MEQAQAQARAAPTEQIAVHTFLIADVRGYTRYTLEHGDAAAATFAARFAELAREVVTAAGGEVVELRGDEALAVFSSTRQALLAATQLQRRYTQEPEIPFRVGIGLDAGEAIPVAQGYRGAALNLAARLCSLAGPGEVLASDAVVHLARRVEGISYAERGFAQLKGFTEPVRVIEVVDEKYVPPQDHPAETVAPAEHRLPIGGFLGSLPDGLLVGRDEELARILQRVEAVAGGTGQLVVLAGEPGVGKTRLAQEVTLQLRNREFLLGAGRCYDPQQAVAFYPFFEALAALFEAAPAAIRTGAERRWPFLGQLLPEQLPISPVASESADDQQRIFRAVTGFLQALAAEAPVAVLLDDLHWADPSSLELLQHVARHTRADRVLLLGTYRDVEVGRQHPLESALHDLVREGLLTRIEVRRLARDDTEALIAATIGEEGGVSDEFTGLVYGRTEGNPFFVQQVMHVLVERGDVFRHDGVWDRRDIAEIEVPESVRSVIGRRLSRLSEETQAVLREASVLGQSFNFDELQWVSGREEREVETALEEASQGGIVRSLQKDDYAFDHALTQQMLFGELSPRRRRRLHVAAGDALERLGETQRLKRAGELAWHFLQGDDGERAIEWSLGAGDQAELVFAHSEAESHYRTALELATDTGDENTEAAALERLGSVLAILARHDEALEALERAASIQSRRHDRGGQARLVEEIGRVHAHRGTADEGVRRIETFLAQVEEEGGDRLSAREQAGLHVALARLYFTVGRVRELIAAAERAIRLAEEAGDDRLLAQAGDRLAVGYVGIGRWSEARSWLERALALAERGGDLATVSTTAQNLAVVWSIHDGDMWKHLEYRRKALEAAERAGDLGGVTFGEAAVSLSHFTLGEWDEAYQHAERGVALSRSLPPSWTSSYPPRVLGTLLLWRGREAEGRSLLDEALRLAERADDPQGLGMTYEFLGSYEMVVGRPEEIAGRWTAFLERLRREGTTTFGYPPSLAWAYMEQGDEGRAADLVALGRDWLAREGIKWFLWETLMVAAMLARRQERWTDAERDLDEALVLTQTMPYPLAESRILDEYGLLEMARGQTAEARKRFQEALAIARRLGARPVIERVEKSLAAIR